METIGNNWQEKSAVIRRLKSAWIEAGPDDGDIVLLLHGYPDTPECWEYQIRELSKTYRIIAPFMRGVGDSDPGESVRRYGTKPVVLDLLAILDLVDPGKKRRINCVGHDLGSVYAWNLVSALGERASSMVIINGLSLGQMLKRWKYPQQLRKSWYIYLMQLPVLPELLLKAIPAQLLNLAHRMGGLEESRRPDRLKVLGALKYPVNQYRSFFRELPQVFANPTTKVSCPVLILWGSDDAFLMPPRMDELKSDADDVTVRILNGGHWLQRQMPEQINELLIRFFGERHDKRQFIAKECLENDLREELS